MIKQLSIFIENRPGRLSSVTQILDERQINIRAFTIQDRGDYGLMKLIVDKPENARLALSDRGYACAIKDVLAVAVTDKPGNLNKLTTIMHDNDVNIADVFGFVIKPENTGVCCMEIHDKISDEAMAEMEAEGFKLLDDSDMSEL
ncbi:MAG: ACT domain-containing protein [Sedimentisphaeraceae bacterium JB056]